MTDAIEMRDDFKVVVVDSMGSDYSVVRAARVSTLTDDRPDGDTSAGLINFLMANRHGSPFEHATFTWRVEAPIFVWREFMRHRIASYNEQSGRYTEMLPHFYCPPGTRPLTQIGKPGAYEFVPGSPWMQSTLDKHIWENSQESWHRYKYLLDAGVAKEVARMVLPVNIYSVAYVTMNARGLMNFLSLRTKDPDSKFPSYPQWEIEQVAKMIEESWKVMMPITHQAFHANGRVCP